MPELSGVHHVALTVRDCDASARWYGDVLGLRLLFAEDGPQRRARILGLPSGAHALALVEHLGTADDGFDPRRLGLDHAAFTVPDRPGMDAWAERLTAAGVEHSGVIDIGVGAILNFKDPDGIAVAVFWDA